MKGAVMMKSLLACSLLAFAAGCFGSDPNENSHIYMGSAGSTGTGTGTAGTSGTGSGGSGTLGAIVGTPLATFDTSVQGFILDDYMDSDPTMYTNIANMGEWASKGKTPPAITFNNADGSPSPGSLQVVAPFDGKNQHFDVQSPSLSPVQNWAGGTLHVRIRLTSGS